MGESTSCVLPSGVLDRTLRGIVVRSIAKAFSLTGAVVELAYTLPPSVRAPPPPKRAPGSVMRCKVVPLRHCRNAP